MARVKITGIKEVDRKLAVMPERVVKKIVRSALRKATNLVAKQMKARAPVDEGELKTTIRAKSAKRSRRNKYTIIQRAMTDPAKLETIHRDTPGVFNPTWIEYGAPGHMFFGRTASPIPPRPFARPAADAARGPATQMFVDGVRTAVNEACREKA